MVPKLYHEPASTYHIFCLYQPKLLCYTFLDSSTLLHSQYGFELFICSFLFMANQMKEKYRKFFSKILLSACTIFFPGGCAVKPYTYNDGPEGPLTRELQEGFTLHL